MTCTNKKTDQHIHCEIDKLACMFSQQIELQRLYGNGQLPALRSDLVMQFSMGIVTELGEVLQAYKGWKPWNNSDNYTYDKPLVEGELADLWHFIINLSLSLGYNSDDIKKMFDEKHDEMLKERFNL